eukprot:gene10635-14274_t
MPSDLMFQIVARDQTRAAFDAVGRNANDLAGRMGTLGRRTQDGLKPASHEI